MPLVFVHGVANRESDAYAAARTQREVLFRTLVLEDAAALVKSPYWGGNAVSFSANEPFLPNPSGNEAFAVGAVVDANPDYESFGAQAELPPPPIGLGSIAAKDGEQAIDIVVMAALQKKIDDAVAAGDPASAGDQEAVDLARSAAMLLEGKALLGDVPQGFGPLAVGSNEAFGDSLDVQLGAASPSGVEGYGLFGKAREAVAWIGRVIGNGASDLALRAARRGLSRGISYFLGDVFVYLGKRDLAGQDGTRERIFAPIIADLVAAARNAGETGKPLIVVAHSLGGVILYDMLTDETTLAQLEQAIGGAVAIDALVTVGSQPGYFADLGLYRRRPSPQAKLPKPASVGLWINVFDYTDVFSFCCEPFFEGVEDFAYDTVVDLVRAHSSYFLRPSFYKRMRKRLVEGHIL